MDSAILAEPYDSSRTKGSSVTETRATGPAFPPGRYGRRRDGRRHHWPLVVLAVLTAAGALLYAWRMYTQYGDPTYQATVIRYADITDTSVRVDFRVRVPAGAAARCLLRARSYDGARVGLVETTVEGVAGARELVASRTVATTARPFIGEVVRCGPVK
jgi:hypothetical protein